MPPAVKLKMWFVERTLTSGRMIFCTIGARAAASSRSTVEDEFMGESLPSSRLPHHGPAVVRDSPGPDAAAWRAGVCAFGQWPGIRGPVSLRRMLAVKGAAAKYIDPGSPWQNGREERFNGIFRDERPTWRSSPPPGPCASPVPAVSKVLTPNGRIRAWAIRPHISAAAPHWVQAALSLIRISPRLHPMGLPATCRGSPWRTMTECRYEICLCVGSPYWSKARLGAGHQGGNLQRLPATTIPPKRAGWLYPGNRRAKGCGCSAELGCTWVNSVSP